MRKMTVALSMALAFLVSGCGLTYGPKKDSVVIGGSTFVLYDEGDGNYVVSQRDNFKDRIYAGDKKSYDRVMGKTFKALDYFARKHGWSHFVLLNNGVNNLNGFPIDNYRDLKRYVTLHARKKTFQTNGANFGRGTRRLIWDTGTVAPYFRPVKMNKDLRNSYISVWSVSRLHSQLR